MARKYTSEILTWESADKYLGTKKERPLPHCASLRIERLTTMLGKSGLPEYTGEIVIRLHGNTIVRFEQGKDPEFPYKGRFENSPTTKRHRSAFGGPWKV